MVQQRFFFLTPNYLLLGRVLFCTFVSLFDSPPSFRRRKAEKRMYFSSIHCAVAMATIVLDNLLPLKGMDTVKEYLGYINPHWVAVVATGIYTHLRQICIIGLCFDEDNNPPFDPSYASVLFIFSVSCLLAEYRLWPRTLKEPPIQLLYIYEMLVAALATNLATRAVWVPLMHVLYCLTQESSKFLFWLNTMFGLSRYSFLNEFAYYMKKDCAATHMAFCMSVLSFVWMLDATESLEAILDTWAKEGSDRFSAFCKCRRKKISFANPEVSDWFVYKFMHSRDPPNN